MTWAVYQNCAETNQRSYVTHIIHDEIGQYGGPNAEQSAYKWPTEAEAQDVADWLNAPDRFFTEVEHYHVVQLS